MERIINLFVEEMKNEQRAAQTDFSLRFELTSNFNLLGDHGLGRLRLYPFSIAKSIHHDTGKSAKEDPVSFGRETVKVLAHEFRHFQQDLDWDSDNPLPSVRWSARATDKGEGADLKAYWDDPGEKDAREFSERVVKHLSDALAEEFGQWLIAWCNEHWSEQKVKLGR